MVNLNQTSAYELENATDLETSTDALSEDKLQEAASVAIVWAVICEECGKETHLIGVPGHNAGSSCENCGESYRV